ncbi:hypothetical protein [Streptomyces sp. NPDC060027]|uniref:hypothetical protein n=1 Tax=Streptomyces sp. NPDC060027 TaxID=3347040 RepID=UPI0036C7B831
MTFEPVNLNLTDPTKGHLNFVLYTEARLGIASASLNAEVSIEASQAQTPLFQEWLSRLLREHGPAGPAFWRFGRDHREPLLDAIGNPRRGRSPRPPPPSRQGRATAAYRAGSSGAGGAAAGVRGLRAEVQRRPMGGGRPAGLGSVARVAPAPV